MNTCASALVCTLCGDTYMNKSLDRQFPAIYAAGSKSTLEYTSFENLLFNFVVVKLRCVHIVKMWGRLVWQAPPTLYVM